MKSHSFPRYLDAVRSLQPKQVLVDLHIPTLLVFAPGTDLHDHVLYTRGDVILQDKVEEIRSHLVLL